MVGAGYALPRAVHGVGYAEQRCFFDSVGCVQSAQRAGGGAGETDAVRGVGQLRRALRRQRRIEEKVGAEVLEAVARQAALGERDGAGGWARIGSKAEWQEVETGCAGRRRAAPDQRVAGERRELGERVRVAVAEAEVASLPGGRGRRFSAVFIDVQIEPQARQARGLARPGSGDLRQATEAAPGDRQRTGRVGCATLHLQPVFGAAEVHLQRLARLRGAVGGQLGEQHRPIACPFGAHTQRETVAITCAVKSSMTLASPTGQRRRAEPANIAPHD